MATTTSTYRNRPPAPPTARLAGLLVVLLAPPGCLRHESLTGPENGPSARPTTKVIPVPSRTDPDPEGSSRAPAASVHEPFTGARSAESPPARPLATPEPPRYTPRSRPPAARPLRGPYHDLRRHTKRSIGEDVGIDVSPDGRHLLFSSTRESELPRIYLKEESSPLLRAITSGAYRDIHPKFSPDGRWVAFASDREGNFDVWLVPTAQPNTLEQVTSTIEDEIHPTFSPDGKRIAFCRYSPRQGWNVWIKNRDAQTLIELGPGLFPEWSPTGDWIAFQKPRERDGNWFGIWVIRPDGSDVRLVASFDDFGAIQPTWSPTGDKIAFTTTARPRPSDQRPGHPFVRGDAVDRDQLFVRGDEINVIELEHGRVFQLTSHDGSNWSPVWGLDGRIYFTSDRYGGQNILSLVPPEVEG